MLNLTLEQVEAVARFRKPIQLDEDARRRIQKGHAALQTLLDRGERISEAELRSRMAAKSRERRKLSA